MVNWKKRALRLISGLVFSEEKYPATIPYTPGKTSVSDEEDRFFCRCSPEEVGVSSSHISALIDALETENDTYAHNLMIVKDGCVISECSHPGYSVNLRQLSHSMSKTVTGMAIGMLVDEGRIGVDDKVLSFFPEIQPKDKKINDLTVRHLLTMTSGVPFSEIGVATEDKWTEAFFASKLSFDPGSEFAYNSMNSYILAVIVTRVSGLSLTDFLIPRLFSPLEITNYFWERSPEGIEKGGFGLHLSTESWAKLGVVMQSGGRFFGKRILSRKWVSEALGTHALAPESSGNFNYGYHIWVGRDEDTFMFSGMFGQTVYASKNSGIIAVVNAENNVLFQRSATVDHLERFLKDKIPPARSSRSDIKRLRVKEKNFFSSRRAVSPLTPKKGISYRLGLKSRTPFPSVWESLLGSYAVADNNQGIMPIILRAMSGSYSGGVESFSFARKSEKLFMNVTEGGIERSIPIGLYGYEECLIEYGEEKYICRAIGDAAEDDMGNKVYRIELRFPELPNSRRLTLRLGYDGIMPIEMSENPNQRIAEPFVTALYTTNPKLSFAISLMERRLGNGFVENRLKKLFSPTLISISTNRDDYRLIIEEENQRRQEEIASTKIITSVISRFASEDSED